MMPPASGKIGITVSSIQKPALTIKPPAPNSMISRTANRTITSRGNSIVNSAPLLGRKTIQEDFKTKYIELEKTLQQMTEDLNSKIKELEDEKNELKNQIEENEKFKSELTEKNEILVDEIKELNKIIDELRTELKNSQNENAQIKKKLEEKESDLSIHKTKSTELENTIELQKENLSKIKIDIEQLNSELAQTKTRLRISHDENDDLQAKIRNLNKDINEKKIEMIELMNKYDAAQRECNNLKDELNKTSEMKKQISINNELLTSKFENKSREMSLLQIEYDKITSEKEKLSYNYGSEQQKVMEMIKEIQFLKEKGQKDSEIITNLNAKINDLLNNNNSLKLNIAQYVENISSLKDKTYNYEKRIALDDIARREMHHKMMELRGTIRVCCRVRPTISKEDPNNTCFIEFRHNEDSLTISSNKEQETVTGSKTEATKYDFKFDAIFGPKTSQSEVFAEIAPLIESALNGFSVCIFAYGQTGSGKTYTMEGDPDDFERTGMIERSVGKIFGSMTELQAKGWLYDVYCSFLEIYNDNFYDLLAKDSKNATEKLEIKIKPPSNKSDKPKKHLTNKCNDFYIPNLTVEKVHDSSSVKGLLSIANRNRRVAATKCNEMSSRSHSIFILKLSGSNSFMNEKIEANINLVDLAGSERMDQSGVEGERLKETQFINKSLSTLKNVIFKLSKKEGHVPYRDSKLTQFLQPSLEGKCKTLMFVNISPMEESYKESLSSLRFATNVCLFLI